MSVTNLKCGLASLLLSTAATVAFTAQPGFAEDAPKIEGSPIAGKTIVMSMQYDWEPLSFKDDSDKPTGYFYEIATEAAKRQGATVEITSGDFAAVIPAIQSGKFDAAVGVDATAARQEVVDIVSHVIAGYRMIVLKEASFEDKDDMSIFCGKTVALLASHPAQGTLEAASAKCVSDGKGAIKIDLYPDRAANFLAIKSGRADATAGYTGENGWLLRKYPELTTVGPIFDTTYAGVPVQKGSPVAAYWQKAIDSMIADGSYKAILEKYDVGDVAIKESSINPAK